MLILTTILIYFCVLMVMGRVTSRKSTNDTFYRGERKSPWYMLALGLVGASISGITFVSVPGMVIRQDMTYLQTCLGFIVGYFVVAFVLLPVYYRLNLTTIYTYLQKRLGRRSYKTGALFFLLSEMTGTALRFYVVCSILQRFVFGQVGIPFGVTVVLLVLLIWLYTRRGGIKTLVWTDTFQTICMMAALLIIIAEVVGKLDMTMGEAFSAVMADSHSRIFVFDDFVSTQNFFKQFISGVFIVVVMTGLDQHMMQKNLTCKTLRDAQKDMCVGGFFFVPVNFLFLALGVLLMMLAAKEGMAIPADSDELLPMFAASGWMGNLVLVLFSIGIVAASFSGTDSALTAVTTSFCVDIKERPTDERLRRVAHLGVCALFALFILMFRVINSTSVIDAIYIVLSYTSGPLLGLFSFGILTRSRVNDKLVPYICVASPLICFAVDQLTTHLTGYKFGYELLLLNGILVFIGLFFTGKMKRA
ncbi:sodium:solute symporter [uncultured Prevotella sp.]|uniref:sodium:solute symporter n=1 Tax=uncultured Prevotella sp. TaxID=159272 RepID=UPI00260F17D3|nr:sodium:solute symporter [uncultured Prevotella sp.]